MFTTPNQSKFYESISDICNDIVFIKKGKKYYANIPISFDIETSSFYEGEDKKCCMYAWVFGVNGKCIRGRTWNEFIEVINYISNTYGLNDKKRVIIYIHNLSYEFQWFRKYFKWINVFSVDSRKPLYALTDNGIEFRCSYLLTGLSLEKVGENLIKYKISKKVGDLDYSLLRHSNTYISEKEWGYILNDALIIMCYIQEEIERLGDITKIPLTKTGYVRDLCREKCLKGDNRWDYIKLMKALTLTPEQYEQAKRAYSGGFTHANSNYVDKIITNVHSYDFTSSYPSVMLSEKYPMSKPILTTVNNENDFAKILKSFCCMFECKFYNIQSIVDYENYISISRCFDAKHYVLNNGRVVEATELSTTLTEQDFFIISRMYKWDYIEISNLHCCYKDYLPKNIIETVIELYGNKTTLKGVEGKEAEYLVSKGMVNALYGMCVTDICRDEIIYNGEWLENKADINYMIEKYNKNNQRFLFYMWGVWVTAYARKNLFSGILEFENDYIYSDTDSIKVINIEKHQKYILDYNKTVTEKIYECLSYYNIDRKLVKPKTIEGIEKPLGVWEYEGYYTRFKTLGAKRYIFEKDGELQITIAGVSKKYGLKYLKHKYITNDNIFNNFNDGIEFPAEYDCNGVDENGTGKLTHTYIDFHIEGYLIDYMGVKYHYIEESGVHMENSDYTLNLDAHFVNFILGIKDYCFV